MEPRDVCRTGSDWLDVDITVSPRSNRPGLDGYDEWRKRMILRVSSPPLEGRANKEVCRIMTDITGCKAEVTNGMTSHQKTVRIHGDPESILKALEEKNG